MCHVGNLCLIDMFQVINVKQNNAGLELKPFSKQGNKDFKKKHTVVTFSPPFFPLMVVCYWVSVDLLSPQREGSSSMTLFTSYTRSSGAQMWLYFVCMYSENVCLLFEVSNYFLQFFSNWTQRRVRKQSEGERVWKMKTKRKKSEGEKHWRGNIPSSSPGPVHLV